MRLLVPLDVHGCADAVVDRALWLARLAGPEARVDLLTVVNVDLPGGTASLALEDRSFSLQAALPPDTAALLLSFARLVHTNGVLGEVMARTGPAAATILAVCGERKPDLLVMGSHARRGLKRAIFGSVAEEVLRGAPCGVLVEPAGRELAEHISEDALQADAERTG